MRLRKVVLGYPDSSSDFKFDLSLNYRLSGVIHTYSDDKPTLVVSDPHTPVRTRQVDVVYTDKKWLPSQPAKHPSADTAARHCDTSVWLSHTWYVYSP